MTILVAAMRGLAFAVLCYGYGLATNNEATKLLACEAALQFALLIRVLKGHR